MNPFTSAVVRGLVEDGSLQANIARLVGAYTTRVQAMDASLRRHLPEAVFTPPRGGYFFWVRLPGCDVQAFRPSAQAAQVDFRPGILFSSRAGLQEYIRLSISYYGPDEIDLGLSRLGQALHPS